MNTKLLGTGLLAFIYWTCCRASATTQNQSINLSTPGDYVCAQRGPHSRIWQLAVLQTNQSGEVRTNLHSYTELATGLCYLQNGQYVDSAEEINVVADGAQAIQTGVSA
jgi:hypothetical protein